MKTKLMFIFLLVSLAFNIAFLGGYLRHHFEKSREHCFTGGDLQDCADKQRDFFEQQIKPARREYFLLRKEFFKILKSEDFAIEEAKIILIKMSKTQSELETCLGENLIKLRQENTLKDFKKMLPKKPKRPKKNNRRIK